ncbi:MAG TPA: glycosidase, partial [Methylomirabilota bacterium]|nr:glycosidase [Methylomirabilota bacterium]
MRPFSPTTEEIARRVVAQVMDLPEAEVVQVLDGVLSEFGDRHHEVEKYFHNRFAKVRPLIVAKKKLSLQRQTLIGAYFTHEYSPESAALFNPSIVPHPDQSGLPHGALRFILSLRATGEGHISSITFRVGVVNA